MESLFIRSGLAILKCIQMSYLNSAICRTLKKLSQTLSQLTQHSALVVWLLTPEKIEHLHTSSYINKKLKFSTPKRLVFWLKESLFLRIILSESALLGIVALNVTLYAFLPTSFAILFSLGIVGLLFLKMLISSTVKPKHSILRFTLLSFLTIMFTSVFFNEISSNGLTIFVIYGSILAFTNLLIWFLDHPKKIYMLIHALAATTLLVSLHGIYQRIVGVSVDPAWLDENAGANITRIYSVFGNPNVFGEFLVLSLPLVFAGFNIFKKWSTKAVYFTIFALGFINVFLTFSRGSMVSLVGALVLIVCFKDRKYLPLFVVAAFLSPFFLSEALLMRILSVFTGGDSSTAYRVSIYAASFDMLKDHVFTGVGLGNFKELYKVYAFTAAKSYHAHNTLLMFIIEQGILGLVFFITVLVYWGRKILSVQKNATGMSYFAFAALTAILGCLAQSMVDHIFHNYNILFYFFIVIAIGASAAEHSAGEHNAL